MTAPPGPRFLVEFDLDERCPFTFGGDPGLLLFFLSWAFSAAFGGDHDLARAALELRRRGVDLDPLLRYADRHVESASDAAELERSWQPAVALASAALAVAHACETADPVLTPLVGGYPDLPLRLRELAAMCDWGAARGARVRMSFDLRAPGGQAD